MGYRIQNRGETQIIVPEIPGLNKIDPKCTDLSTVATEQEDSHPLHTLEVLTDECARLTLCVLRNPLYTSYYEVSSAAALGGFTDLTIASTSFTKGLAIQTPLYKVEYTAGKDGICIPQLARS